jgi:prolyl oligopeptidase
LPLERRGIGIYDSAHSSSNLFREVILMKVRLRLNRAAEKASLCCLLVVCLGAEARGQVITAPVAPIRPVIDEYFGTRLTDPYRYLEDLKNPEVESWFKGQDAYTRSVLAGIPGRDALLARIRELDRSTPSKVRDVNLIPGGRYLYTKMMASEIVSKLYVRDGLESKERLLLDPEQYHAPPGSHNAINYISPSFDGKMIAVGVSPGGSENAIIHILEVDTGKELPETIDRARFGFVSWRPDHHSFFYNRLQKLEPGQPQTDEEQNSKDYLHELGTSVEKDLPVFATGLSPAVEIAAADIPFVFATLDGKWAVGLIFHGVLNEFTMYRAPLESVGKSDTPWVKICDIPDDVTGLALHGDELYLQTHKRAPRFKVVRTSLAHPDLGHATLTLPESEQVITNIAAAKDALYVQELDGTVTRIRRVGYDAAAPEEVPLPFEGAAYLAATDERIPGTLVALVSWARAPRIYGYDPESRKLADTRLQPLGPNDDPQDIVAEEMLVKSWDGVMVPLSIVHKRDLKKDGSNPTLLDGYGSYGITLDPEFDPIRLAWLERGGIFAVAHSRGGGEYGEDWHKAGQKLNKPNTWRDFIACGEYLVNQHFTSPSKLAGTGTSAGGITIGRAFTERPELFAAAIDRVGVSNAVRGEDTPNGPPNIPEFGTAKDPYGFQDLYSMDAYHHVRDGVKYPAVLLTTGWNDPRVVSWEPGKMAARLQAATASGKPVLLRVDYAGGHGMGSTKAQTEEEMADDWSFLLWQFGVPGFQPGKGK